MQARIFCEVILNEVLPAVRAIIANRLINVYGLTQNEVAKKLGLTQPAVSQYKNGLRGRKIKKILSNKEMVEYIDSLCDKIATENLDINFKVCEICTTSREKDIFPKEYMNPFICLIEIAKVKNYG
jgi:predicted transcriptional regulator